MVAFALFRMFPVKGFFSWPLSTFKYDWVLLAMIRKSPFLHESCMFLVLNCFARVLSLCQRP